MPAIQTYLRGLFNTHDPTFPPPTLKALTPSHTLISSEVFSPTPRPPRSSQTRPLLLRPSTRLPPILDPIQPTPPILAHLFIPRLLRQLRGTAAPHAGLAIKHDLAPNRRLLEAEPILELVGREEQAFGRRCDRHVVGGRDEAGVVLVRLAHVDEDAVGFGRENEVFDLRAFMSMTCRPT